MTVKVEAALEVLRLVFASLIVLAWAVAFVAELLGAENVPNVSPLALMVAGTLFAPTVLRVAARKEAEDHESR